MEAVRQAAEIGFVKAASEKGVRETVASGVSLNFETIQTSKSTAFQRIEDLLIRVSLKIYLASPYLAI